MQHEWAESTRRMKEDYAADLELAKQDGKPRPPLPGTMSLAVAQSTKLWNERREGAVSAGKKGLAAVGATGNWLKDTLSKQWETTKADEQSLVESESQMPSVSAMLSSEVEYKGKYKLPSDCYKLSKSDCMAPEVKPLCKLSRGKHCAKRA